MGKTNKILLTKQKLRQVFDIAINTAPTPKYIAYGLGIRSIDTIKSWILIGMNLQENFEDKLDGLYDISPWHYRNIWEQSKKLEADAEFRQIHQLEPDTPISDRQKLDYNMFLAKHRETFVERNIERLEWEYLEDITLSDDETIDNEYKLFILFERIFTRAKTVVEMGLLEAVNKHSKTSKNIALGYKMLQTYNQSDFGEIQTINHTGVVEVNNRSILSMALNYEREQKERLEQKETQIIDVQPIQQIEQKEEK